MRLRAVAPILIASIATAQSSNLVMPPPARYDHIYSGELVVRRVPLDDVIWYCGAKGTQHLACARIKDGWCRITVPIVGSSAHYRGRMVTVTPSLYRALWQHERAHCNGWPATHPRA